MTKLERLRAENLAMRYAIQECPRSHGGLLEHLKETEKFARRFATAERVCELADKDGRWMDCEDALKAWKESCK